MRIVCLSYNGNVGKTTISVHLIRAHMPKAEIVAVESINESAKDLGLEVLQLTGEAFREVYEQLLISEDLVVDVGASNVEAFIGGLVEFQDAHHEVDLFVIPVTPGLKEQKETIATYLALVRLGVDPQKIQVVLNRTDNPEKNFEVLFKYRGTDANFRVDPRIAVKESTIFEQLGRSRKTLQSVLEDETDYKALMSTLRDGSDPALHKQYLTAHILRDQAQRVRGNLDRVFDLITAV